MDLIYYVKQDKFTLDEFREYIQEYIDSIQVMYYVDAMKFLLENDYSLQNSLELAKNAGFELDNLDSEKLASLLKQDYTRDDLNEIFDNNIRGF